MTFTLRKMSGKGIRMVARYLGITSMGGMLEDTPEAFYERLIYQTGLGRPALERKFTERVDEFETKMRDEEGFLSRNDVQRVCAFVEKKLGPGMWVEGEVEADHRREGAAPSRRGVASTPPRKVSSDVNALRERLKKATDPVERRKLRRQLRKLGHRGGARE